jgi:hypothetical protein
MFEMLITGVVLFALGTAIVALVGALVTWPFDLKAELKRTKNDLEYTRDQVTKLHRFIRNENLETKYRNQM